MEPQEPNAEVAAMIEQLLKEDEELNPDPVDLFEDELARRLGLRRHPAATIATWRRARLVFVGAHVNADRVAEEMQMEQETSERDWSFQ